MSALAAAGRYQFGHDVAAPGAVPNQYVGLWRRRLLETPDRLDRSSEVYWLQTSLYYADIRLPAGWPERREGLDGFAGQLQVEGDTLTWQRWWSITPCDTPDVGRMSGSGDLLEEHGVLQPYREEWERLCDHRLPSFALVRQGVDGPSALLLGIGNYFMLAEPDAEQGCRVRFGFLRCQSGPWRVCGSTDPALTGQHWRPGFRLQAGAQLEDGEGLRWEVAEASFDLALLPL